jgi:hypothetical protein
MHVSPDQLASSPTSTRRLDAGYEVRISARRGLVTATAASFRAPGALKVAEGRPVGEAVRLAGLLFPMNASAQTAAALSAAEAALRMRLPSAQIAARQLIVGFEAAAACAWRMGLVWPQLSAAVTTPAAVQQARAAADAVAEALYENGEWVRLGGGAVRPSFTRLQELLDATRRALDTLSPALYCLVDHAPTLDGLSGGGWPLLDDAGVERAAVALSEDPGFAARPHLGGQPMEESPRAILKRWRADDGLEAWFRAQAHFAEQLPSRLAHTLREVAQAEPATAPLKGSGKGWGMAVSARGRIIHWMAIERGCVAAWRAIEPTDWNFAPRGPMARAAELLAPDASLAEAGRWLIAAFDPSAPCRVVLGD